MLSGDGCLHSKGCAFCLALAPEQLQPLCSSLSHPYCPGGQASARATHPQPTAVAAVDPDSHPPQTQKPHAESSDAKKKEKKMQWNVFICKQ